MFSPAIHRTLKRKTEDFFIINEPAHEIMVSHRRPVKAQTSLRICAVSPQPSLFANMKYGSRRRVQPKIRHLAPLDGWAYAFEEWVYRGTKSAIISWAGSNTTDELKKKVFKKSYDSLTSCCRCLRYCIFCLIGSFEKPSINTTIPCGKLCCANQPTTLLCWRSGRAVTYRIR